MDPAAATLHDAPTRPGAFPLRHVALAALAAACSGQAPSPEAEPVSRPVIDIETSEAAAVRLEQDIAGLVLEPLVRGQLERAARGLAPAGEFAARLPEPGAPGSAGPITWTPLSADPGPTVREPVEFLADLLALAPLDGTPARVECELERFRLDADVGARRATGRVRIRWAGDSALDDGPPRVDLTLRAEIEAVRASVDADWLLRRFTPLEERPGERLAAAAPRFRDRTAEVGLTFARSPENKELFQAFVDRQLTLTLGGLSVVDWNRDDRPDLIATRTGESSLVFLNDGAGGFVPEPLPIEDPAELPAFVLAFDLDGDGLDELVAGEASLYEGDRAYAGLWTRTGAEAGTWRHLPRAFAMPNAVGLRRLAVQTVAPIDVEGDGDLDLFFAVYGSARSHGAGFNMVDANDGADNHLFINQGGLEFTEESDERGISGTRYSYIAMVFDADHDGDDDVFEGNDFGLNVLWRNEGGRFVADESLGFGGVSANTMGATLADLDADGRWDLYVSNMSSEEGMRMGPMAAGLDERAREVVDVIAHGNVLYSQGAPGARWDERARRLGIHEGEWAWGCQFFEPFADGTLGLVVTNGFTSHRDRSKRDWESYNWRQVIEDARAIQEGRPSADANADAPRFQGSFNGYERDRLFVPTEGAAPDRPWIDAGWLMGLDDDHDGRAVVPIDADGDGDQDLALWTLGGLVYRENTAPAAAWARIRLLEEDGSPALGARVTVTHAGRRLARRVALVEGFQSQVSTDIHVGLGVSPAERIDAVEVRWKDGSQQRVEAVEAQRLVTIRRGQEAPEVRDLPRWTAPPDPGGRPASAWVSDLVRVTRTPSALSLPPGTPMVVRVHSDPPPVPELGATVDGSPGVGFGGVRVVDAFLRTGAPTETDLDGRSAVLLEPELFAEALGAGPMATIVTGDDGTPLRIFRGPTRPADVKAFCELARHEPAHRHLLLEHGRLAVDEARYRDGAALFERATRDDRTLRAQHAYAFEGLGRARVLLGRLDLAEAAYRRAVALDPDYAAGWFNLAATFSQQGRFADALPALAEVRRIEGDTRRVLGSLAEARSGDGDLEGASVAAEKWLRSAPADVAMLVLAGKLRARQSDWAAAIAHLEQAVQIAPGNAEARAALTEARRRR